jgi:hypothetical protein
MDYRSRDSSVGIATGYGPDGRGSITGREKILLYFTASRPNLGPIQWAPEKIFPGTKRTEREADH